MDTTTLMVLFVVMLFTSTHAEKGTGPWEGMDIFCEPKVTKVDVEQDGCLATDVEVKYCQGKCKSATTYTHEYPFYKSVCECCKSKKMENLYVEADCGEESDGKRMKVIVRESVTECECSMCETKGVK